MLTDSEIVKNTSLVREKARYFNNLQGWWYFCAWNPAAEVQVEMSKLQDSEDRRRMEELVITQSFSVKRKVLLQASEAAEMVLRVPVVLDVPMKETATSLKHFCVLFGFVI